VKDFFKRILGFGLPKDALIAPQGIILTLGEDRKGVLHGTTRRANALVSGGTSRDRIEKIIIPTLFRGTSASYVVDDPTGEIFAVTAAARARLRPVSRIQRGAGRWDAQCRYNPIAEGNLGDDPDTRSRRLRSIAEAIVTEPAEPYSARLPEGSQEADAEIQGQAISVLWGLLELSCTQVQSSGNLQLTEPTLHAIGNVLLRAPLSSSIDDYVRTADGSDNGRALFELRAFADLPEDRQKAVAHIVTSRMLAFYPEKIAWLTGEERSHWEVHEKFVPADAVVSDGPATVYVNCPKQYGEDHAGPNMLTQILWRYIIDEALHVEDRRDKARARRDEIFLFTDCEQILPVPGIGLLTAQAGAAGLSVLVSCDDISSLDRLYGPSEAQTIKENMGIEIDCAQNAPQFIRSGLSQPVLRPLNGMSSFLLPAPRAHRL
jgi:hypothetical protein